MSRIKSTRAVVLVAGAIATGVAFAPLASAEPCQSTGAATICQSNGSASMSAAPQMPAGTGGGANNQNGSYGPSGDLPPIGN